LSIYEKSGSIGLAVITHGVNNVILFVLVALLAG
jgi:membrane protease YdiL (CAAX protease family)